MFGLGCTLTLNDFRVLLKAPKALFVGLLCQLLLVPILAILVVYAFQLPQDIAFGMLLVIFCPGGPVSNLVSNLCNGDVALSVSLTSVSSCLCLITTPFWIHIAKYFFSSDSIENINLISVPLALLIIVIAPIYLGMFVKGRYPIFSYKIQKFVKLASVIILLSAIVILSIAKRNEVLKLIQQSGFIVLVVHFATILLGFIVAIFFKLKPKHQITIAIESGYQNNTLAIVLATTIFNSISMSVPGILYGLVKSISAIVLYFFSKRLLRGS